MFEKTLTDLIKGIRAHKGSEAKYIDASIGDCRKEIKGRDPEIKAQAILKLAYVCDIIEPTYCLATNVWIWFLLGFVSGHRGYVFVDF